MSTLPDKRKKHRTLGASDKTVKMARKLRRQMSLPEILLWRQLQEHPGGYLFRKQHPIGPYALDFACIRARLAIEVDGEAHERGNRLARDDVRDAWVLKHGFQTLRIPAVDVLKKMEGVIIAIVEACRARAKPIPPRNECRVGLPPAIQVPSGGRDDPTLVARSDGGAGLVGRRPSTSEADPTTTREGAGGPPPRSGEEFR